MKFGIRGLLIGMATAACAWVGLASGVPRNRQTA